MKQEAFDLMRSGEDSWWYVGRRAVVIRLMKKFCVGLTKDIRILDVGAGFGLMWKTLSLFGTVDAFEPETRLREVLQQRGYHSLFFSWKDLIRSGEKYDVVGAFDVVEHAAQETEILSHMFQSVRVGGHVIVSVPAYQWLWSRHDEINNHYRRYTAFSLTRILSAAGFEVVYCGYWNTILFPLAVVARIFNRSGSSVFSDKGFVNWLFTRVVSFEALLMGWVRLPWGLSVFAVARKVT